MIPDDLPDRVRVVLSRLGDASGLDRIAISVAALAFSVLLGAVLVLVSGLATDCASPFLETPVGSFCYNPLAVYWSLFYGAFGTSFNLAMTFTQTTLLVFTGLSVAVAFRAGMFNIGTQGQLVLGGLATAVLVHYAARIVPQGFVGGVALVLFGLVAGAVVGGAYGAIPGALKAYADANEVITTIMLNFIASGVAYVLVAGRFQAPDSQTIETARLPEYATLDAHLLGGDFSLVALLLALALVVGVALLLEGTAFGYDLRTSGVQPEAGEYAGVDTERTMVASMTLSGAFGGIAGALWVLMVLGRWVAGVPPLGFDGIAVSVLAGNNPIGVVPAAFLFGAMKSGSLATGLSVPNQLVDVLRGLVILFVAMPEFFRMLALRWGIESPEETAPAGGGDS